MSNCGKSWEGYALYDIARTNRCALHADTRRHPQRCYFHEADRPAGQPVTVVRTWNTNTDMVLVAPVPVRDGKARVYGDAPITGSPGSAAEILTDYKYRRAIDRASRYCS